MSTLDTLGRALINAQPQTDGCQLHEREVVGREFVVASGNPTAVLDLVEEPFHQIASTIQMRAGADRTFAISLQPIVAGGSGAIDVWKVAPRRSRS